MKEEILREFGLTEKEIKVYLACLRLGTALVQDIAKRAGTYRTYTYEILKSLIEKGLVSYVIKSGKQYFEVAEPEKLINILKEREEKIKEILPELKTVYKSTVRKPKIEVFEGKEGLKTILDDIIRTGENVLVYSSTKNLFRVLEFYFPQYIKRRVKAGIRTRVITEETEDTKKLAEKAKEELREMRFLLKKCEFPTANFIYGNKIAMLSLEKEPLGILIEDDDIVKTQKMVFELIWKKTREVNYEK